MRRIALGFIALVVIGGFWVLAGGSGDNSGSRTYWVELDNAFGLVSGADVKVAGVRAGKIGKFRLDTQSYRALVELDIDQQGFDQFRSDAFCESKPQSLIGEYFIDCQPGVNGTPLPSNATIPVSQTASTVSPDLVNNILRLPYRQRFRIILNELGAAVAGNGANLQAALRRAVPALRDTDRVLAILASENHTLADLVTTGDQVVTPLANNHANVGRWVQTANATSAASAARRVELAQQFAKLPGFLEALRPNLKALGQVTDAQTPALQNLNASASRLTHFFRQLAPFASASTVGFKALGQASVTGDQAVKAATPTVAELNKFATGAPELGQNLAIVFKYLDDPAHAVETDQRAVPQHSDGRANYTGLEAILQYVFDQTQAVSIFDAEHYILKVDQFVDNNCAAYTDAKTANAGGDALFQECSGNVIGPRHPGLYGQPDISDTGVYLPRTAQTTSAALRRPAAATGSPAGPAATPVTPTTTAGGGRKGHGLLPSVGSGPVKVPSLQDILPAIQQVLPPALGGTGSSPLRGGASVPGVAGANSAPSSGNGAASVLNYLLGQ